MYKFVKLYKGSMNENRVEFITPSGQTKKYLITEKEKEKIESIVNMSGQEDYKYSMDNFLYSII